MLTSFIFLEVIICILSMLCFMVSLSNFSKNGKFDFIEMFKSLLIFSGIALFSVFIGNVMFKDVETISTKTISYKEDKKTKKLNTYRKKQGKQILLVEKNQSDAYFEYLKKNKLDKKALK